MVKCASCGKLLRVKVSGSIEASIQFSFVDFFLILVGFLRRILRNIFHWIVGLIKESMHIRVWSWKLRMKKNAVDRYTFFFINNESTIIIFISSGIFFWEVCFGLTVNCDLNSSHKLLSIVIFEEDFILKVYTFIQQCYLKS